MNLCTATLDQIHSAAEYCAPAWYRSSYTCLIDPIIDNALRILTGYLCPTPMEPLPVLEGIPPAQLRSLEGTLSLDAKLWSPATSSTPR